MKRRSVQCELLLLGFVTFQAKQGDRDVFVIAPWNGVHVCQTEAELAAFGKAAVAARLAGPQSKEPVRDLLTARWRAPL